MPSIDARWSVIWLLACLLATVLSAPVNEADSAVNGTSSGASSDFDAAIAEIRAKREALRKKSAPASRLELSKFASFADDDGQDSGEQDDGPDSSDDEEAIAALLAGIESPVELNALAKEIALDILMDESAKEARRSKKKKSPARFTLDDERRKRANALFYQLMDQDVENNDDDAPFGGRDSQEERDGEIVPDSDDSDDEMVEQSVVRALANQGLDRREIEALLSQLDETEEDDVDDNKRKKKRSGDWRKFPRAALRWRFLQSLDADDPATFQYDDDAADAEEQRFFGRGFHRMGPGVVDEISRGMPGASDKRMLRPLKMRRTLAGIIKKRSVSASADKPRAESPDVRAKTDARKKRSVSGETAPSAVSPRDNKTETTPPRALPLAAGVAENRPQKDEAAHSAVIRKKSVDWDDYFGFDKRKRAARKEDNDDDEDDEVMKDYLENEYYKAIAGSLAYRKKRGPAPGADHAAHGMMKRSNSTPSAGRAAEQRKLNQLRAQMVAHLMDDLDADDLDEMADRLTHDLVQVLRQDEQDFGDEDDDDETVAKRAPAMQPYRKRMPLKKKKSLQESAGDEKRKRLSFSEHVDDADDAEKRRKRFRVDDDKRRKRPSDDDEKKRRKRLPVKRAPRLGRKEPDSDGKHPEMGARCCIDFPRPRARYAIR